VGPARTLRLALIDARTRVARRGNPVVVVLSPGNHSEGRHSTRRTLASVFEVFCLLGFPLVGDTPNLVVPRRQAVMRFGSATLKRVDVVLAGPGVDRRLPAGTHSTCGPDRGSARRRGWSEVFCAAVGAVGRGQTPTRPGAGTWKPRAASLLADAGRASLG